MARQRTSSRIRMTNIRREQLFDKCKGKCLHCGCDLTLGDNFSIEHIIPLSKGGTNDFDNTVALCKDCNFEKGDDVVEVEFYRHAPKIVYEKIEKILEEYHENHDWLTAANVFKHDRYTIPVQQSIVLPNGKVVFKDAECELKKMADEEYEDISQNVETREVVEQGSEDGEIIEISKEGTPFKITFKGKTVATMFCGLDARKDMAEFRIILTVSKETNWGPSSRYVICMCVHEALNRFKASVEEKGTKGVALCNVDAPAHDKRAVETIKSLCELWKAPVGILSDAETDEVVYVRAGCATAFNLEVDSDDGTITRDELFKKGKLYNGQLKRRVKQNG